MSKTHLVNSLSVLNRALSDRTHLLDGGIDPADVVLAMDVTAAQKGRADLTKDLPSLERWRKAVLNHKAVTDALNQSQVKGEDSSKSKKGGKRGKAEPPSEAKRLKILCLHGYRQDGESFRVKLGAFRKAMKKYADMEFISAPHVVPSGSGEVKLHWIT